MSREVKYTGRDFQQIRSQLEELARKYFPDTFSNYDDYSPESMFMDMMSYLGDTLNFNIDDRFRQNFIQHASEPESIFRLAKSLGYKPATVSVAMGKVEVSQLVPSVYNTPETRFDPDVTQAGTINLGTRFSDVNGNTTYELVENVNMETYDRAEVSQRDGNGDPEYFRIFKAATVRSGTRKQKQISVGDFLKNLELFVDRNVSYIESVVDADGNDWFEVEYLSQDSVFESIENENINDDFDQFTSDTPSILKVRRVSRRFIVDHKSNGECYLQFGQGNDLIDDNLRGLNAEDLLTTNEISNFTFNNTFVVENFIYNDSYGFVPSNTNLTVTYITSSGQQENAKSNTVTNVVRLISEFPQGVDPTVQNSVLVNNPSPITGSKFLNDIESLRFNISSAFASQRRCVTIRDYMIRSKLLPKQFGNISKVFVEKDDDTFRINGRDEFTRKTINLYTLSEDDDGNFTTSNIVTKQNLRNYLNEFRIATDVVNIIDPYIINIAVYFEFIARKGFNKEMVELELSQIVESYFAKDKWEINQPIIVEELRTKMLDANGVLSIPKIDFRNRFDTVEGYSGTGYDVSIQSANFDREKGILYPPADVSIFELKYPRKDIIFKHA